MGFLQHAKQPGVSSLVLSSFVSFLPHLQHPNNLAQQPGFFSGVSEDGGGWSSEVGSSWEGGGTLQKNFD